MEIFLRFIQRHRHNLETSQSKFLSRIIW